jgi:very-short-patch-repair endonuclease
MKYSKQRFNFLVFILSTIVLSGCQSQTNTTAQSNQSQSITNLPTPQRQQQESHLQAALRSRYQVKPLLKGQEYRLFMALNKLLRPYNLYCHAQVSLGEVFTNSDYDAYRAIMAKRADICIVDSQMTPVALVEFDGKGHYTDDPSLRDATKGSAAQSAGIHLFRVFNDDMNHIEEHIKQSILPKLTTQTANV